MLRPGDRVLALDYRLWAAHNDINMAACIKPATVISVYHCEHVPLDESYRVLVDIYFDHRGEARSYFEEQLHSLDKFSKALDAHKKIYTR